MIKSFNHKDLEKFFINCTTSGIQPEHATKIRDQLAFLHAAKVIDDIDKPGYRLHPLRGTLKGKWSIAVSANWRIVFKFEDGNAYIVNYEDYH